jgi:hypothetical protein
MHPGRLVGDEGPPDCHEPVTTGPTVEGTVVGWGLGGTVIAVGAKVMPPIP